MNYWDLVKLTDLFETDEWKNMVADGGIPICIGREMGSPVIFDLRKPFNLVFAGGASEQNEGMTLTENLIASAAFGADPHKLQIQILDSSVINLEEFKVLPHLYRDIVWPLDTDILADIIDEMKNRENLLRQNGTDSIETYNRTIAEAAQGLYMPYLLVVVSVGFEFLELGKPDFSNQLLQLVTEGAKVGIRLVVDMRTGWVDTWENVQPELYNYRAAFWTSDEEYSKAIIGSEGADELLGNGDMLLKTPDSLKPVNVQIAASASNEEMQALISEIMEKWSDGQ